MSTPTSACCFSGTTLFLLFLFALTMTLRSFPSPPPSPTITTTTERESSSSSSSSSQHDIQWSVSDSSSSKGDFINLAPSSLPQHPAGIAPTTSGAPEEDHSRDTTVGERRRTNTLFSLPTNLTRNNSSRRAARSNSDRTERSFVLEVGTNSRPDFSAFTKAKRDTFLVAVEPVVAARCERNALNALGKRKFAGVINAAIGPAAFSELFNSSTTEATKRALLVVPEYHSGPHRPDNVTPTANLDLVYGGRLRRQLFFPHPLRSVSFSEARNTVCSSLLQLTGENGCVTKRRSIQVPLVTTDELIYAMDHHFMVYFSRPLPIRILSFDLQGFDLNGGVASLTSREYINDRVANVFVECVDLPVVNVSTPASPLSHSCGQAVACIEEHWGFKGIYCSANVAPDEYNCLLHNPRHRMQSGEAPSELGSAWHATAPELTTRNPESKALLLLHPHINKDIFTVRSPRYPAPCPWAKQN